MNSGLGIRLVDPMVTSLINPEKVVVRRFAPTIKYCLSVVYPRRALAAVPGFRERFPSSLSRRDSLC
ncbi:protein of unknown function [Aminobacter niigataensis]|nr:protein of unknown function [Aminobacter niigataensis]